MIRAFALGLAAISACGRSSGVPDEQLGDLVVERAQPATKIDVDRASREPSELGRALTRPYDVVLAGLGVHTIAIHTTTTVEEAGKAVQDLADDTTIENGDAGTFHATYNNSAEYGREAVFVGKQLYLRPRYQRWHERAPEAAGEPVEIRNSFYGAIPATWDLVGYAAELTDRGAVQVGGRSGRKIEVKLAPHASKAPRETLTQRKWREGRSVEALAGTVVLDIEGGSPLAVDLAATIGFSRDGRSFQMKLKLQSSIANIGTAAKVAPPDEGEIVATPGRLREVDDRDYLLQGIAPPIRRNPDGTAVPPAPVTPTAGSAAPAKSTDKPKAIDKPKATDKPKPDGGKP